MGPEVAAAFLRGARRQASLKMRTMTDDTTIRQLEAGEAKAGELAWMPKLAAAALTADVQACARCDIELVQEDGAVSIDREQRTTTRICDQCVSAWMADHPQQYVVRALDLVQRDRGPTSGALKGRR